MLPGSESSGGQNSEAPTLEGDAEIWPDEGRQSRRNYRRSDRKAEPQPRETRVRFKFARRAHQRKFTPKLGINLAVSSCQEERGKDGEKVAKGGKSGAPGGDSIEWSWAELPGSAAWLVARCGVADPKIGRYTRREPKAPLHGRLRWCVRVLGVGFAREEHVGGGEVLALAIVQI